MEYMLVSTEKKYIFQSRNPGIWALPIPGFGIKKNVRDPGILDPWITIPKCESVLKATKQVNRQGQNSTPRHTKTP